MGHRGRCQDCRSIRLQVAIIVAIALGGVSAPPGTDAQAPPKVFRVAYLAAGGRTPDGAPPATLRGSLRGLGWVEGQNIAYEARFAEGRLERLPPLAAELVRLRVDVIVTVGAGTGSAAKQATSTIPIVLGVAAGDAVATGLIASLARPGGNITGMSDAPCSSARSGWRSSRRRSPRQP
jgi:putative ABC transport system substrate-binding protein